MEYWSANDQVIQLLNFIKTEIKRLENLPPRPRYTRQINDGKRFLKMVSCARYCNTEKISELRKAISKRRTSLKELIKDLKKGMPGEQMDMFEVEEALSDEVIESKKLYIENCEEEVKWLHKALGICSSKDYFK